jgi:hypothetical protein
MLKKLLPACILVFSACLPFFAQSQSQGIFNLRPIDIVVEGAKANITSQLNFWSQFTTKPDTKVEDLEKKVNEMGSKLDAILNALKK